MSKTRNKPSAQSVDAELFLRSINIAFDADFPERISHFRPTAKCVPLIRALLGSEDQRAFFLVAPYGSGKSLTAAYAGHLVENSKSSGPVRLEINRRLEVVSPDLADFAKRRRASTKQKGLSLCLHGHVANVGQQLRLAAADSLKRIGVRRWTKLRNSDENDIAEVIKLIRSICDEMECDRVTIVWDEFGRHLEGLVAEGRGDELAEIQLLAEIASRTKAFPITFCAILHQGLSHYASGLPQAIRSNWKKIEGRFETIQYVDDSKEIYRLIGEVIQSRAPSNIECKATQATAKSCLSLGLFSGFSVRDLSALLKTAYPMEPTALYLLPRVSARVAQNERTLFSFLYNCDLNTPVRVSDLYDFFSPAMRADTAVGGTYRQWLETESAISKLPDDESAVNALKTACLLGLGTSGARSRTTVDLMKFAINGYEPKQADKILRDLFGRKLLLHRVHNDDVSVWHGTDLDLRGRLDEERSKLGTDFDLVTFLNREASPPVWKPVEYNDTHCIRRFLPGSYLTKDQFNSIESWVINHIADDSDGHIAYLLADSEEDLAMAEEVASKAKTEERLFFAVPSDPLPLRDAAIEVSALQRMQQDSELVESDPIALSELQQMTDDALEHLQKLIDRLVTPSASGAKWFHDGNRIDGSNSLELRRSFSAIMANVFSKTPMINNEMINRRKPSPALVNARKKLTMAILERHGRERLGLEGFFPDRSMFNTVLLHTGLYRKDEASDRWSYVHENSLKDPGMKAVWGAFRKFLTESSDRPTTFQALFARLQSPPFGLRLGVMPILLAAALRAFPSAISLMHKGKYLNDVLPSDIENICKFPSDYQILVLDIDASKQKLLRGLYKHFSKVANYEIEENDLVRHCFDALEAWKHQLPPAAFTTGRLSEDTDSFRATITRVNDPVQLFFTELPKALSKSVDKPTSLINVIRKCVDELENVASSYTEQASEIVRASLTVGNDPNSDQSVRAIAKQWASFFPGQFIEKLSDGVAKGMLSRMSLEYESDSLLIDSLASLLVKKSVRRWDDSMAAAFDREFTAYVSKIENSARTFPAPTPQLQEGLSRLVLGRIQELYHQLSDLVGEDEAKTMLKQFNSIKGANRHGVNH
ncbi:hypothetical protein Pla22_37220 [Rubripirellula amarantea]|uniref:Uncharacterized protein n=1 Tax=Rubripirellula amarantea TaxID=2527999 RepID=A0A5C5WJN4_9BACT|nr:hypothetical protein [Rubripirellula amarantea]TWT50978.1 hypothetical protein Pla22_37220 [Rubripirellula amarantea]